MAAFTKNSLAHRFSRSARALALVATVMAMAPTWAIASDDAKAGAKPMPAAMDHSKMAGMNHMAGMSMTGQVDYDFAANMRKHHQMAVVMAQAELKNGKDAKLLRMAKDIIAAQNKEIAVLDRWIQAHHKSMTAAMPKAK